MRWKHWGILALLLAGVAGGLSCTEDRPINTALRTARVSFAASTGLANPRAYGPQTIQSARWDITRAFVTLEDQTTFDLLIPDEGGAPGNCTYGDRFFGSPVSLDTCAAGILLPALPVQPATVELEFTMTVYSYEPIEVQPMTTDTDGDGIPDDGNGDGIPADTEIVMDMGDDVLVRTGDPCTTNDLTNCDDNCPFIPNADEELDGTAIDCSGPDPNEDGFCQADTTDPPDGFGDACTFPELGDIFATSDADGDGVIDVFDNCPARPNPFQEDTASPFFGETPNCAMDGDAAPAVPDGIGNVCCDRRQVHEVTEMGSGATTLTITASIDRLGLTANDIGALIADFDLEVGAMDAALVCSFPDGNCELDTSKVRVCFNRVDVAAGTGLPLSCPETMP